MRYRVTYNVFLSSSGERVTGSQVIVEVSVEGGEEVNDVAYGGASNLLAEKFVVGGEAPFGPPVSVERL
jgi:hypothetical protein